MILIANDIYINAPVCYQERQLCLPCHFQHWSYFPGIHLIGPSPSAPGLVSASPGSRGYPHLEILHKHYLGVLNCSKSI